MEKTCGNCRYKGKPILRETLDDSGIEIVDTGYFFCGLIKMGEAESDPNVRESNGPSYVVDGSGYYAALCVADDFGCNRWEKNP